MAMRANPQYAAVLANLSRPGVVKAKTLARPAKRARGRFHHRAVPAQAGSAQRHRDCDSAARRIAVQISEIMRRPAATQTK